MSSDGGGGGSSDATQTQKNGLSNVNDCNLTNYFWTHTVAALSSGTPPPCMDFLFDGFRTFRLQAEGDEFLLLDYEDEVSEENESKRGFEFDIEDEDAPCGRAFAREFKGERNSIDQVIDQVCTYFDAPQQ